MLIKRGLIMCKDEINEKLSDYIEENCHNCYAKVTDSGLIHLDDKFEIKHLKDIMKIIEQLKEG
jgi:hypothetical protein